MCLDIAYFAENWKLMAENNKKVVFDYCSIPKYCKFAFMHYWCFINSARGAGQKKKKKKKQRSKKADAWVFVRFQTDTKCSHQTNLITYM